MHLADGEVDGHRILTPQTARGMRTVVATGRPFHPAVGWFRKPVHGDGEDYVEHFGARAGFWNVMRLYPTRGVGIVVMTNSTRSSRFHELLHSLARRSWGP
jgi:CubicO group peptidase (beta-lactamase class C family)